MKNKMNIVAKIIFWILYFICLLNILRIILVRDRILKFWGNLEMELPMLTRLYADYGQILFVVVIAATLFFIIKEIIKKKSVSLETISLSFVALLFLIAFFLISFLLPMARLASFAI